MMAKRVQVRQIRSSSMNGEVSVMYKVIIVGNSGVGKTCLALAFGDGAFPETTDPTIGVDFKEKSVKVDSEIVRLQLWDTAGQERFRQSMTSRYYRDVHAVLLVYDITNQSSFNKLNTWIREIHAHTPSGGILMFLIGNKTDLAHKRVVDKRSGHNFAEAHNMNYFWEVSVKDSQQEVDHIFFTVAAMLKSDTPKQLIDQCLLSSDENIVIRDTARPEITKSACCNLN